MKLIFFTFAILMPALSSADWLATNGCTQNTVESTCLEALDSCSADYTHEITSSVLTLEPDGVTPAFVNITYNVFSVDGTAAWYNQGGQCGWSSPACTAELPYDPETEACTKPPQFLTCGYSSVLNFFPSVSGFTSADSAGSAFCAQIDTLDEINYPFLGNTGSGVDGNGGDIFTTCGDNTYTNFLSCSLVTCSVGEALDYSTNSCVTSQPEISPTNRLEKTFGNSDACGSININIGEGS